ncbi:hypothetical protein ACFFQW_45860 [Umezawaea endophytica]|uniref:Protein kinase domain-containing protein n=1 Tax=Umezawaea endophytica TaxID=1654476 RepID=A0A9X3A6E9_9PSEU|nr:hypothetical protein [Umezawaea endophytica]MCS7483313.1 hypothetical protein [Umezawaea endophytica]
MRVSASRCEELLIKEISGTAKEESTRKLLAADSSSRVRGAVVLLQNVLDHIANLESSLGEDAFGRGVDAALSRFAAVPDDGKVSIRGLLALVKLNASLLKRRFDARSPVVAIGTGEADRIDGYDRECRKLFADVPAVRRAIREVYGSTKANAEFRRWWDRVDFEGVEYLKAGTTSFILKANSKDRPATSRSSIVVKCVLFPWNKMFAVAQATANYADTYGGHNTSKIVVQPMVSTEQCILMPYQPGRTLREDLWHFEQQPRTDHERLVKAREVARHLVASLHRLADKGEVTSNLPQRQHLDLSPNNVIIDPETGEMHFIDLGRNHLYSRQVGIAEHDDSVYVAPEVKNRDKETTYADAYSLGVILAETICGYPPRSGQLPVRVWQLSPQLGTLLQNLIEWRSDLRLFSFARTPFSFERLGKHIDDQFALALKEGTASKNALARAWTVFAPSSREVWTQVTLWRGARHLHSTVRFSNYLLFFSVISSACWWFVVAKAAPFKLDDVLAFEVDLPSSELEWAAKIVALSQGLVAAKFYQTILGRVTARGTGGATTFLVELLIRLMAVIALPTTVIALFWRHDLWAWCLAGGALAVALANLMTLVFARRMLRTADDLFPKGSADANFSTHGFEQWWWTMLLYACLIAIIALGLDMGWLHDTGAYVFGLTLISIGIHYTAKCIGAGFAIRGELARAFFMGERSRAKELLDGGESPPLHQQLHDEAGAAHARP